MPNCLRRDRELDADRAGSDDGDLVRTHARPSVACHPEPPKPRRRSRSAKGGRRTVEGPPTYLHREKPVPGYQGEGPSTVLRDFAFGYVAPAARMTAITMSPIPSLSARLPSRRSSRDARGRGGRRACGRDRPRIRSDGRRVDHAPHRFHDSMRSAAARSADECVSAKWSMVFRRIRRPLSSAPAPSCRRARTCA